MAIDYFYDQQLRRLSLQVVRVFSGFQYEAIDPVSGNPMLRQVPARMSSRDRMVQHIKSNNSENVANSVPLITVTIRDLDLSPSYRLDPMGSDKHQIIERHIDDTTNKYTTTPGVRASLERYMPIPVIVLYRVEIWTSNLEQKFQIWEQAYQLFNPSLDLQITTDKYDWTAIRILELKDMTWTTQTIPMGTATDYDNLDITQMDFQVQSWITPPAKLYKQQLINQIVVDINDALACENIKDANIVVDPGDLITRIIHSPGNHKIRVVNNEITLLGSNGSSVDKHGQIFNWQSLLNQYGQFRNSISQLRLKLDQDLEKTENDITGIISLHPTDVNKLLWSIDILTLPKTTLQPILGIINPQKTYPGNGIQMPAPGQRYLLLDEFGSSQAWGVVIGHPDINDIIEFNGSSWFISFDSSQNITTEIILNQASNKQLKWFKTDTSGSYEWILAVDAVYNSGFWRLAL